MLDLELNFTFVDFPGPAFPQRPAQPAQPSPSVAINPSLNIRDRSRPLCFDLSRRPSKNPAEYNFHPDLPNSAFYPNMTYVDIIIPVSSNSSWVVSVHNPQALTVYDVLAQVQHFLQQSEGSQNAASSRLRPVNVNMNDYRDHNSNPQVYREGVKRLDILNPRRFCIGFEPEAGSNAWRMHLTSAPL